MTKEETIKKYSTCIFTFHGFSKPIIRKIAIAAGLKNPLIEKQGYDICIDNEYVEMCTYDDKKAAEQIWMHCEKTARWEKLKHLNNL